MDYLTMAGVTALAPLFINRMWLIFIVIVALFLLFVGAAVKILLS